MCLTGAPARGEKSPSVTVCRHPGWDDPCARRATGNCLHLVPEEYVISETKENKGLSCSELPSLPQRRKVLWLAWRISFHPKGEIVMDLSSEGEDAGGWVAVAEKEPRVAACHTSVAWGL